MIHLKDNRRNTEKNLNSKELFDELLKFLKPDIILLSCNKDIRDEVFHGFKIEKVYSKKSKNEFEIFSNLDKAPSDDNKYPKIIHYTDGKQHLIWGPNWGNMFDKFSDQLKEEIFNDIKQELTYFC